MKWIVIYFCFQLTLGCLLKIPRLYREETLSSGLHIGESHSLHTSWHSPLSMWWLSARGNGFSMWCHKSCHGIWDNRKSLIQQFGCTRLFDDLSIKYWIGFLSFKFQTEMPTHILFYCLLLFFQLTWSSNMPKCTQSLAVQKISFALITNPLTSDSAGWPQRWSCAKLPKTVRTTTRLTSGPSG